MSSEWPRVSLRSFADLLAGFAFKSSGYTENSQDVRLLRGDNIAPGRVRWDGVKRWPKNCGVDLARYALQPGDVVLAMDRPWIPAGLKVAQTSEIDTPSYLVQRVARLRTGSGADCDFLFSLLSAPEFEAYIQNATTGTAVPHISAKQILDYEFRLPPASVRAEVGALLAAINNRITLLRETNTTLEAIAQALFKSWFVDFDPVHAKMQGRAPEGMIDATAALFPDSFEESELGDVPKGWHVKSLDDVASFLNGLALQKFPPTGDNDLPVIKIAQLRKGDTVGGVLASRSIKPLTGLDAPCVHTLYVDKPMKGHSLMQAIARVNRVFKEKQGGLVVDYIGIGEDLKAAMKEYTASKGRGKPRWTRAKRWPFCWKSWMYWAPCCTALTIQAF